jgi:hypothetical protein
MIKLILKSLYSALSCFSTTAVAAVYNLCNALAFAVNGGLISFTSSVRSACLESFNMLKGSAHIRLALPMALPGIYRLQPLCFFSLIQTKFRTRFFMNERTLSSFPVYAKVATLPYIFFSRQSISVLSNFRHLAPWAFVLLFLVGLAPAWAQTDRIPVAEGAFSNGSSFAANNWNVSNSSNHQWVVSGAHALGAPFAGDAAFVSNNSAAYAYTPANNSNIFFWRDVTVPAGESIMTLLKVKPVGIIGRFLLALLLLLL